MKPSGGKVEPKVIVEIKHLKRTKREWKEITNLKLRQWETIGLESGVKKSTGAFE